MIRVFGAAVVGLVASGCAIRSYDSYRIEFDSATGYVAAGAEPARLELDDEVVRWPWAVRVLFEGWGFDTVLQVLFDVRPDVAEVDTPGAVFREAMAAMTERAVGDLGRTADLGIRALWIDTRPDAGRLARLVAVETITRLLEGLDGDPLVAARVPDDPAAATERETAAREALAALDPSRRQEPLDAAARAAFVDAVRDLSRHPSPRRTDGREAIRRLVSAVQGAPDDATEELARRALTTRLVDEFSRALLDEARNAPAAELRRSALLALIRLSGPRVVPFALAVTAIPSAGRADRYDPDPSVRRLWVRICGAVPPTIATARWGDGPRPIDLLFDMTQQTDDRGLARVARDAMARCVGVPATDDPDWPARWWSEFVAGRVGIRG